MDMKKWVVTLVLAVILAAPGLAYAQEPVRFASAQIDIMPEYDQPDVLIMYHLFLPPETSLPVDLTLRIPAAVGDPYNLAMRGSDGNLYNIPYERSQAGDWASIQFTAPSTEIRFEYYDPNLEKNGPERAYTYQWPGDYAIDQLAVLVQQPIDTQNLAITPDLGAGLPGEGNLLQYNAVVGSLDAGQSFGVNLSYTKSSDRLTSSSMNVEPAGPISEDTPGRLTVNDVAPWAIGVVAVALIAGGSYWYWQSVRGVSVEKPRRRRRSPREAGEPRPAEIDTTGQVYCHRCGKRATPGDVFCRACGAKLRKED